VLGPGFAWSAVARVEEKPMPDHRLRKIGFILAATDHGPLIVNRFDHHTGQDGRGFGVGFKILNEPAHEAGEISIAALILESRRRRFGDGVVVVDCRANMGIHTVSCATQMTGWGFVIAIEVQEQIYYALTGNLAINNCFNVRLIRAAGKNGIMKITNPAYLAPAGFGSLELRPAKKPEQIGQTIDYSDPEFVSVDAITIDSLALKRLDLLKIDVEGMECEVLEGAKRTIRQFLPIVIVEHLKTGTEEIVKFLRHHGYHMGELGLNILAIHPTDKTIDGFGQQATFPTE